VPGIESSRPGDPPTDLRQVAQGYIGLQNHGGEDAMEYRNIRVEDLSADAPGRNPTGPFEVGGQGPHTVEFRSVDAAGNVEAKQVAEFQIGDTAPPSGSGDPPVPPIGDAPATYRLGSVAKRLGARTFARRGLKVRVACTGAMRGSASLMVSAADRRKLRLGKRTLATRNVRCFGAHTAAVTLKPSKAVARRLTSGRRSVRGVQLTLTVRMADLGRPARTVKRTISLRQG
jgi:hypothetical protein